jgi:hypothetical protein
MAPTGKFHWRIDPQGSGKEDEGTWEIDADFERSLAELTGRGERSRLARVLGNYREALRRYSGLNDLGLRFLDRLQWDPSQEGFLQEIPGTEPGENPQPEQTQDRNRDKVGIYRISDFPQYASDVEWDGAPWWTLSHRGGEWRLDTVNLTPERLDSQQPGDTAKMLMLPKDTGIEYVLSANILRAGAKAFLPRPKQALPLDKAGVKRFSLGVQAYAILIKEAHDVYSDKAQGPSEQRFIFLDHNGNSKLIAHMVLCEGSCEEYEEWMDWVGDLDDDGRVDFIVGGRDANLSCDYVRLFLSGNAAKHKRIGFVKEQYQANCEGC